LIEHYAGAFPLWLAPCKLKSAPSVRKLPITQARHETLKRHNLRVHLDDAMKNCQRNRDAQMQKIPYMLVVGAKEAEAAPSPSPSQKGDLGPSPSRSH